MRCTMKKWEDQRAKIIRPVHAQLEWIITHIRSWKIFVKRKGFKSQKLLDWQ